MIDEDSTWFVLDTPDTPVRKPYRILSLVAPSQQRIDEATVFSPIIPPGPANLIRRADS